MFSRDLTSDMGYQKLEGERYLLIISIYIDEHDKPTHDEPQVSVCTSSCLTDVNLITFIGLDCSE